MGALRSKPVFQPLSGGVDLASFLLFEKQYGRAPTSNPKYTVEEVGHRLGLWILSCLRLHLKEHKNSIILGMPSSLSLSSLSGRRSGEAEAS